MAWDFSSPVVEPLTLTAAWDLVEVAVSGESVEGGTLEVAVTGLAPGGGYELVVEPSGGTFPFTADASGAATVEVVLAAGTAGPATVRVLDGSGVEVLSASLTIAPTQVVDAPTETDADRSGSPVLPRTGSDPTRVVQIAAAMVMLGAGLVAAGRRVHRA